MDEDEDKDEEKEEEEKKFMDDAFIEFTLKKKKKKGKENQYTERLAFRRN